MSKTTSGPSQASSMFALITIPVIIVICILLYLFVLGNPSNFQDGDPNNHPLPGNYLGIVYKGGQIVPILMAFFLMVIVFSVERFLTITRAKGAGSISVFVRKIKSNLETGNVTGAIAECDKQKGSVGNVIRAVLVKYKENSDAAKAEKTRPADMVGNSGGTIVVADIQDKEQRMASIQKELEDSTSLELPMLEKNLTIIATLASVATLTGLLGTVIGMIKAFAALATAGAPDATSLANGISEALINTALGIAASAFAIIFYNYFTSEIDSLTYSIDEAGYSILQSYSVKH